MSEWVDGRNYWGESEAQLRSERVCHGCFSSEYYQKHKYSEDGFGHYIKKEGTLALWILAGSIVLLVICIWWASQH